MIRLAIIGTAGRKPNQRQILSWDHMQWMADTVKCYIEFVLEKPTNEIILVSGGSAWADHVAVRLYLEGNFGGLELYLPANFSKIHKKYEPTREGKILNWLHYTCEIRSGINGLEELCQVMSDPKVEIIIRKGFSQRNTLVSQNNDHLIAFTFAKSEPIEGGTYDTWKKTNHINKIHFSLKDA